MRVAFTVNTNLKRLFLSDTSLGTQGAIALAEFLPEARHLLHLDLTANPSLEVAGIMALAVGLRSNRLIRCLDLSIPFNDGDLAALSQDILQVLQPPAASLLRVRCAHPLFFVHQSCIRNTELAQERSTSKASRAAVWVPIQKSTLARTAKEADTLRALAEVSTALSTPVGRARADVFEMSPKEVVASGEEAIQALDAALEGGRTKKAGDLLERGKALRERLEEAIRGEHGGDKLQVLLGLVDRLSVQIARAQQARDVVVADGPVQNGSSSAARSKPSILPGISSSVVDTSLLSPNLGLAPPTPDPLSSPSFSLGDSDSDSDSDSDASSPPSASSSSLRPPISQIPLPDSPAASTFPRTASEDAPPETTEVEDKNTRWTQEEGELFRKGIALGVDDEEEVSEELSGEELKKEVRTIEDSSVAHQADIN